MAMIRNNSNNAVTCGQPGTALDSFSPTRSGEPGPYGPTVTFDTPTTTTNERTTRSKSVSISTHSSSTCSSTARARESIEGNFSSVTISSNCCGETVNSRAELLHGWYKECCEYYAENYLRPPAPVARRELALIIKNGMTAECLKAIMDESQKAPRPSWGYAKAIVQRCEAYGIRTLQDWRDDQARREIARNKALSYQQRDFSAEDVGGDFFVDMNRAPPRGATPARGQADNFGLADMNGQGGDGLVSLPWDDGEARRP